MGGSRHFEKGRLRTLSSTVKLRNFEHLRRYGNGTSTSGVLCRYYAAVSETEYGKLSLGSVVSRYFGSSYLNAVSSLVKEEKISLDELKELIELVEKQK